MNAAELAEFLKGERGKSGFVTDYNEAAALELVKSGRAVIEDHRVPQGRGRGVTSQFVTIRRRITYTGE